MCAPDRRDEAEYPGNPGQARFARDPQRQDFSGMVD
jgi:hypothetical protein